MIADPDQSRTNTSWSGLYGVFLLCLYSTVAAWGVWAFVSTALREPGISWLPVCGGGGAFLLLSAAGVLETSAHLVHRPLWENVTVGVFGIALVLPWAAGFARSWLTGPAGWPPWLGIFPALVLIGRTLAVAAWRKQRTCRGYPGLPTWFLSGELSGLGLGIGVLLVLLITDPHMPVTGMLTVSAPTYVAAVSLTYWYQLTH